MSNGGEYDHVEKRMFDILCVAMERVVRVFRDTKGKGKIRSRSVEVEEDSTLRSRLGKRKLDEYDSDQNPNHVASSSSSSSYLLPFKKRLVVTNEPVRETEPVVRVRKPPVRRVPLRREAPVLERPAITPEWLVNLMREEKGFDAKMIFKKDLTTTDLNSHQNRLLIPLSQIVEKDFLNEEEKRIVLQHHRKILDKGVDVIFVGSQGQRCELNLRRWDMKSSSNYVLVSGWYKATVNNRLRLDQTIHLWSFHSQQRLYFALAPPGPAPAMALALPPPPAPVLDPVPLRFVAPEAIAPVQAQSLALVPVPANSEEICTYEDCLEAEEERKRIFVNFPKRKRSTLVPVASPDPASSDSDGNDGQSRSEEDSDPVYQLAMCCEEWLLSNTTAVPC